MVGILPRFTGRRQARLVGQRRGAVLVEFALVLPILITLVMGVLCYGQYIWLAHSVQTAANDAARVIVAGITPAERLTLAQAAVANDIASMPELTRDKVAVAIDEAGTRATVRLRVDARAVTLLSTGMVPLPEPVIERRAVIALAPL
ncbi:TadE/TadG family type IV pilus assembly protein [Sphingomonas sp. Mn802worker]|uniref:TadE/TadG family type IV pilus assembly protein n=1 Tax=Sphingomonas sp. Mn802worker TaxID=629773 RepID=UPI0003757B64|nr:TadE/TadG family type IV pilus assembly protein [Sphingomonas sp. Mn802worker]